MANLTSNQEKKLHHAFNLFDSNRSGQLSKKELKNVLKALHIKVNDKELQALINQMDANGNGKIDFNEFKAVMGKHFFGGHSKTDLEDAFKRYDSDGNGFLSIDEVQSAMANIGRQMNRLEVRSMIQSLDSNHDGKISFDEFIKLFD